MISAHSKLFLGFALFSCPTALLAQETQSAPAIPVGALDSPDTVTFSLASAEVGALEAASADAGEGEGAESGDQQDASEDGGQSGDKKRPSWPQLELPKIVFDDTWVTVGIGAGLVPSYSGSDDYILFPLPLIVGRVGGVGIRPNGPGIRLDLLSPEPALGPNQKTTFNFGPAIRFRNDRAQQIEDEVVELAEDLDVALEVGLAGGVTFPGVFNSLDSLTFNTQVRWDVLGAHDGMLVEPTIGYARPFGRSVLFQANIGAQFVDDNFADYYFTVTPEQSAATGLPEFTADGGLNNVSTSAVINVDLDGNALNGGLSVYSIVSYTRLVGDGADTPFTDIRGDANQFVGGVGIAYTF